MAGGSGAAIWSPEALSDLDEIWNYYDRVAGRNTALKIVRQIGKVIATLEDHPFAGRTRDELRPEFDHLPPHHTLSSTLVAKEVPEIIRILDSRRDIEEIFSD